MTTDFFWPFYFLKFLIKNFDSAKKKTFFFLRGILSKQLFFFFFFFKKKIFKFKNFFFKKKKTFSKKKKKIAVLDLLNYERMSTWQTASDLSKKSKKPFFFFNFFFFFFFLLKKKFCWFLAKEGRRQHANGQRNSFQELWLWKKGFGKKNF